MSEWYHKLGNGHLHRFFILLIDTVESELLTASFNKLQTPAMLCTIQ